MTEAFYCDFCQEYHRGEEAESLYIQRHIDRQGTDVIHVADACEECVKEIVPEKYL
jgi:hypothetical protein